MSNWINDAWRQFEASRGLEVRSEQEWFTLAVQAAFAAEKERLEEEAEDRARYAEFDAEERSGGD